MAFQIESVSSVTQAQATVIRGDSDLNHSFDMQAALLVAAIENSTFGLIIVSQNGTILHKNKLAHLLLKQMPCPSAKAIPDILWHPCQSLIENQTDASAIFPADYTIVLEDEIFTEHGTIYMRVQWFDWDDTDCSRKNCFLITLENRQQSLAVIASHEAQRYGLTTREADVWRLKRMGNSYKEIASELYISENTVKKHLKNIYTKKDQSGCSA